MHLPLVAPAPLVTTHADAFRDLFANRCQFQHFQHYLTGLMVLSNKSLTNIARGVLESADKTNLSRFMAEAPWLEAQVNQRRIRYMLQQTKDQRRPKAESALVLDDTLCEHVGSLFAYVDRHYNHSDQTYPLAHNPVTSFYVSGPVRFPLDLRLYRRYEEMTQWEAFVTTHFPDRSIPTQKKARAQLHKEVDPVLLTDPAFAALHAQFRTKIALGIDLVETAIRRKVPFDVVLFDGWYLAEDLVKALERRRKAWVSILKKNRNLETNSFVLNDDSGNPIRFAGPHIAVEDLIRHIPASAYRAVTRAHPDAGAGAVGDQFCQCRTHGYGGRVGHESPRMGCPEDHRDVSAPLANRDLLSGRQRTSGPGRVSHAQRRSHWKTLVFGVRGVFVLASGVSRSVTDQRVSPRQNHWGGVSPASAGADPETPALCPRAACPRTFSRRRVCGVVRETAGNAVDLTNCDLRSKHNSRVK